MAAVDVAVPIKVDAFVLNSAEAARLPLAPIVKPDYTRLRLDTATIGNDVLDHVDLRSSSPTHNDRTVDPLTNNPRSNRQGVYVHWALPQFYRKGLAASAAAGSPTKQASVFEKQGFPPPPSDGDYDFSAPSFHPVPNRWIVVRFVQRNRDAHGQLIPLDPKIPQCTVFVVESDRLREDDEVIRDENPWSGDHVDWELECSPYLDMAAQDIESRTGVSIGYKVPLSSWAGEDGREPPPTSIPRRVQRITVADTSNPLFADYQPHDANVLSIFDDMMVHPQGSSPFQIQSALVSYFIYGWHSKVSDDPLLISTSARDARRTESNYERLNSMGFVIRTNPVPDALVPPSIWKPFTYLSLKCHGSVYEVEWSVSAPTANVPCLDAVNLFATSSPVAVGSTALDALLAFIQAHQNDNADADPQPLTNFVQVARDIVKLQTFLLQEEDTVDAQLQAADMLYEQNFKRVASGNVWHFSGAAEPSEQPQTASRAATQPTPTPAPEPMPAPAAPQAQASPAQPAAPSSAQQDLLKRLNAHQTLLDVALREARQMQWLLFAEWWKYLSDDDPTATKAAHATQVGTIAGNVGRVQTLIARLQASVNGLAASLPCQKAQADFFYKQADPTLLIGGIASGWPADWLEPVPVRVVPNSLVSAAFTTGSPPDLPPANAVTVPTALLDVNNWQTCNALPPLFAEFTYLLPTNTRELHSDLPTLVVPMITKWYRQSRSVDHRHNWSGQTAPLL